MLKAIDGLIGIAYDGNCSSLRKRSNQLLLRSIQVLVFIDYDMVKCMTRYLQQGYFEEIVALLALIPQ